MAQPHNRRFCGRFSPALTYQGLPDKTLSPISRMTLSMGRMLVSYALYLVYNRQSNPKAEKLRRKIIQMDPDCVLATRGTAVVTPRGV